MNNTEPTAATQWNAAELTYSILALVLDPPPAIEEIQKWTSQQQEEAFNWAFDVHLEASDNDITVRPKPDFLKDYK